VVQNLWKVALQVMAAITRAAAAGIIDAVGLGVKRRRLSVEAKQELVARCSEGVPQKEVAALYHVTESCVSKIIKKTQTAASEQATEGPQTRRGRPPKLSSGDAQVLRQIAEKKPCGSAKVYTADLLQKTMKRISRWTTRRYLKAMNIRSGVAAKKPLLTARHRKMRLAWAREHSTWTDEDWTQVLFSDETTLELVPNARRRMCYRTLQQKYQARYTVPTVKHPRKIMLWGCFGNCRVGHLQLVKGIINSHTYISIMRRSLVSAKQIVFDGGEFIFQQDNAPCHVSATTRRWFARKNIELLAWPPQSPDLNQIENLWMIFKRRVEARMPLANIEALETVVVDCWTEIPEETLRGLIQSMPERIREVIKNKGGATSF